MQVIIPAADLSGADFAGRTGFRHQCNMKFAPERRAHHWYAGWRERRDAGACREENIFVFGKWLAEEVEALRRQWVISLATIMKDEELHQVLTQIGSGVFNPEAASRYRDPVDSLINFGDHYQVLADYRSYVDCRDKVDEGIVARKSGRRKRCSTLPIWATSSDRTIKRVCRKSGILIRCGCNLMPAALRFARPTFMYPL